MLLTFVLYRNSVGFKQVFSGLRTCPLTSALDASSLPILIFFSGEACEEQGDKQQYRLHPEKENILIGQVLRSRLRWSGVVGKKKEFFTFGE